MWNKLLKENNNDAKPVVNSGREKRVRNRSKNALKCFHGSLPVIDEFKSANSLKLKSLYGWINFAALSQGRLNW